MTEAPLDLIVVGGGVAGLSAARHALRAGLRVALVEAGLHGGLVTNVNELDGDIQGNGAEFAASMVEEVLDGGADCISEAVTAVDCEGALMRVVMQDRRLLASTVVLASGARLRTLGVPGEAQFEGRGVAHCADCDGPMYARQSVVVVGGGDSALQEALVLARFAERVYLVHRRDVFRARPHLQEAVRAHPRITVVPNSQVVSVGGRQGVESVRLRRTDSGTESELACRGLFVYVGLQPASEFVSPLAQRDMQGAIVTDERLRTSLPGLYAVGAVRAGYGGSLRDALEEGQAAARDAVQSLGRATVPSR